MYPHEFNIPPPVVPPTDHACPSDLYSCLSLVSAAGPSTSAPQEKKKKKKKKERKKERRTYREGSGVNLIPLEKESTTTLAYKPLFFYVYNSRHSLYSLVVNVRKKSVTVTVRYYEISSP